jgi:hypothetical protein
MIQDANLGKIDDKTPHRVLAAVKAPACPAARGGVRAREVNNKRQKTRNL